MIGYDGKNWVTTADLIFIGNRRIGEIWKGNRKIYPEVELASYLKYISLSSLYLNSIDIVLSNNIYNNIISYKGVNTYLIRDNYNQYSFNWILSSEVRNYKLIYLNEFMQNFAYDSYHLKLNLTEFYSKCNDSLVINMANAYRNCLNLTGSPVCGPNVTDMNNTYANCHRLEGSPVCGPNVINMAGAYRNCLNLTGSPVCGPNVTNMYNTYSDCYRIIGSPVCGPNVINMAVAYRDCFNLTGTIVIPESVENLYMTFFADNRDNHINSFYIMNIDVQLPAKWRDNGQVNTWINHVLSVSYY